MKDWQSTGNWKPVDFEAVEPLLSSNQTFQVDRAQWPAWAQESTQMQRLWVYCPDADSPIQPAGVNATVVARALAERYDSKDTKPYNYNFHLFALSTDGHLYQSPPIRTTLPAHHETTPPGWLDAYGPPPL